MHLVLNDHGLKYGVSVLFMSVERELVGEYYDGFSVLYLAPSQILDVQGVPLQVEHTT
jgi:hypothetical protein